MATPPKKTKLSHYAQISFYHVTHQPGQAGKKKPTFCENLLASEPVATGRRRIWSLERNTENRLTTVNFA